MIVLSVLMSLASQAPTVVVPDEALCRSCEIRGQNEATLVIDSGDVRLAGSSRVSRGQSGRFVVSRNNKMGTIAIFDRDGRLTRVLRTDAATSTTGLPVVQFVIEGPDSAIFVFDYDFSRLDRDFNPSHRRTALFGGTPTEVFAANTLDRDRILLQAMSPSRELVGQLFHIVDRDGVILRSFGLESGLVHTAGFAPPRRRIAAGSRAASAITCVRST